MIAQWSDYFSQVGASARGIGSKTTKADVMVWKGYFEGHPLCIVSTVRLTGSNLAHFLVHSGARIGTHDWNLFGGHYVDLRVLTTDQLTADELRRIGNLARSEEDRPIRVRRGRDRLADALPVPDA